MKIAIVFYSFSGNTRNLARFIKESCPGHEVTLIDLKLAKEEKSFLGQCRDAHMKIKPELKGYAFDAMQHDLTVFASPVWAFTFAPALRSALKKVDNIGNKNVAAIVTCGSGLGTKKTLQELSDVLKQKGGNVVFTGFVSGHKCTRAAYLNEQLKGLFNKIV